MAKATTRNHLSFIAEEVHDRHILWDTREIFLHGYSDNVEEDPGVDYRMANSFIKNIRSLESIVKKPIPILVHQHSVGGEFHGGMMMYDAILLCESPITVLMHGTACSMGSFVPQAADRRVIMPHCEFMIHSGYTGIGNMTMKQSKSWFEHEARQDKDMMTVYAEVCVEGEFFKNKGMDTDKVSEWLKNKLDEKEDWFMSPRDAVYYGFADAVLGDEGYENIEIIRHFEEEEDDV